MSKKQPPGFNTANLHADRQGKPEHGVLHKPIHTSVAFEYDDARELAAVFQGKKSGFNYGRQQNPTVNALQDKITQMENGVASVAFATGMAAIGSLIFSLLKAGDHLISSSFLFGNTNSLLNTFTRLGIEVTFVDSTDADQVAAAIQENTRLVFTETIANPVTQVADLAGIGALCASHGLIYVVDNTMTSPWLFRPATVGANFVVNSLTKYIGGHGTTVGGIIVDSGNFDWAAQPERFSMLTTPDPSYHGVTYTEALGPAAYIGRCRVVPLRNTGAALSAQSAFNIMQGLETLSLRMERHCENAEKVAAFLEKHPSVNWVNYAALPDSEHFDTCQRICGGKAAGIISFGIQGGLPAGAKFIDALQLILRLVNIGDAKSLACHPASTTHRQLNADELASAGVSEDMVRISVGIEHIDDIIADIEQALIASQS